jgi:hypothetical protein
MRGKRLQSKNEEIDSVKSLGVQQALLLAGVDSYVVIKTDLFLLLQLQQATIVTVPAHSSP